MDTALRESLVQAIVAGDAATVARLAAAGQSLHRIGDHGESALHLAVQHGHADVLDILLATNVQLNAMDADGRTALWLACLENQGETVRKLLMAGANPNVDSEWSPLIAAASEGFEAVVEMLLAAGADVDGSVRWGQTPLLHAAGRGRVSVIPRLLRADADVDKADANGITPLMCAAHGGHSGAVRLLLRAGANANREERCHQTALSYAAFRGHEEVVDLLLAADGIAIDKIVGSGNTALLYALEADAVGIFEKLWAAGANAYHVNNFGDTALMHASRHGRAKIVELLLQSAPSVAIIDHSNREGETALIYASQHGHTDVADLLLAWGADANASAPNGTTALVAASRRHVQVVELLLAAGADVHQLSNRGETALHVAAECSDVQIVDMLLAHGADVNCVSRSGLTPLMVAKNWRHTHVVTRLQIAGAHDGVDEDTNSLEHLGERDRRILMAPLVGPMTLFIDPYCG